MCMNLYVKATRVVAVKNETKKTKKETQRTSFGLWKTPTPITYECLNSNKCAETYIQWVSDSGNSFATRHIENFRTWIKDQEDEGYKIEFYTV